MSAEGVPVVDSVPSGVTGNPTGFGPVDAGSTPASATTPTWVEIDGRRVWSVGWQARRGTSFTPGMVDTLRRQAVEHLDEIQRHNEDPKRVGPERCPAMAWVIVDRLLTHPAAASAESIRAEVIEECAKWHDDEAARLRERAREVENIGAKIDLSDEARRHSTHATSIRALASARATKEV